MPPWCPSSGTCPTPSPPAPACVRSLFMEEMSSMGSPSSFRHSTAWAQVMTLLANLAVAVVTLQVQVSLVSW